MKRVAILPFAVILLASAVLAQESELIRLPAVESRFEEVEDELASLRNELTSLRNENVELRGLLDNEAFGCHCCNSPCNCECICPGLTFSADWLYWQLHQDGLDYARTQGASGLPMIATTYEVGVGRDSGFRSRIGYLTTSGWEAAFAYTYFHTNGLGPRVTYTGPPGNFYSTRGMARQFWDVGGFVEGSFTLSQDIYDLELSRWVAIRNSLALRVFAGYRHATIKQTFLSIVDRYGTGTQTWENQETANTNADGLRLGAEGEWRVRHDLTLSGTLAGSVLYANTDKQLAYTASLFGSVTDEMYQSWNPSYAMPVVEAAVSATWHRGPFELVVGYELSTWFALGNLPHSFDGYQDTLRGDYHDILLEGLFLRAAITR